MGRAAQDALKTALDIEASVNELSLANDQINMIG